MSHRVIWAVTLLLIPAQAQGLPAGWSRAVPVDPVTEGIESRVEGGRVVELVFPGMRVPLANPVHDWEVGAMADGSFVVLAGGVRDSLDLYRVDPETGNIDPFETHGGRRLPDASFGEQLGSWPVAEGRHLLLFAYEKGQKLVFQAIGLPGRVYGTRWLDRSVDGYTAMHDLVTERVEVSFRGSEESLAFVHPRAPHLSLSPALLEFGVVEPGARARRTIQCRNAGGRPLRARATVAGPGFALAGAPLSLDIPAGGSAELEVVFAPVVEGAASARLEIDSPIAGARAVVPLRGTTPAAPRVEKPIARPRGAPVEAAAHTRVRPRIPPLAPIEPGAVSGETVSRLDDVRVVVRGHIEHRRDPDRAAPEVVVRNERSGDESRARLGDGRFELVLAAAGSDRLTVALVDRATPAPRFVPLAVVPVALRRDGATLIANARPGAPFLLTQVEPGRTSARRALRAWRGRADQRGLARVPVSLLGSGADPVSLVLAVEGHDGRALCSPVLRVVPNRR